MLSVFNVNKRNKSQKAKKLSSKPPLKRVQSPPSPASFVSPEIVDINDHGPFGGSFPEVRPPASSTERPALAVSSPQLQLDFDSSEPLFPPSILPPPGSLTPPKRNVSLPNAGRNASDPSSARARGATPDELTIREEPLQPNRLQVDTSVQNARMSADVSESYSGGLPHGMVVEPGSRILAGELAGSDSTAPSSRKPTPSPIKIPNNSTSAKIKVQSSADGSANTSVPPPLPSKNSGPPSPTSALTDDISSAISGTSLARAFATSFILSNESRASKYKSGITRQDSATLPRGEHPLNSSPYVRERRASSGDPGSARSSSVPPVPQLPSRAELGLSMDNTSLDKSQRNSVALVLESGESNQLVPPLTLKRSMSTGRLRREQSTSMPPISPISEGSSPAPSVPETPGAVNPNTSNVSNASSRSLATSLAQQRAPNLSEATASSSSLGTDASGHHARAATEPAGSISTAGDRRPSNATKPKGPLVLDRTGSAMPGTMRSSGAFAINNSRLTVTRTISESGSTRSGLGGASWPAVLLPIGERPSSVLVPPSPQPSIGAPTPTSARVGGSNVSTVETPVDSPDLLDNFPVQIARERSAGPPPPLPLGRRSEDNVSIPTPLHSSSGESVSSTNRQTFPETPNAFSPLWSGTFNSPPVPIGSRSAPDQTLGRTGSTIRAPGLIDMTRMASRGPNGRVSGTVFAKPATRSSRVPPTPPLTGESTSGSRPESPMAAEAPMPPQAVKRLTAIEEQVASRSVSQYSTIPEPPTSGAQFGGEQFAAQQQQQLQLRGSPPSVKDLRRGRERSDSLSAHSRHGSEARSHAPSQAQTQNSSGMSAAEQAKAAEASAHRHMRSVTNPDEPLSSPPPSYPATFDPPPPPPPPLAPAESSERSNRSSMYSSTLHLQASSSQTSIPQKRSLSPLPSPPPSSVPMPPSPGRSRLDAHASSISVEQPPPPYMETARGGTPPVPPPPSPGLPPPPTPPPSNTRIVIPDIPPPPSTPLRATYTPDTTPTKRPGPARVRPPLPHGPRAPSYGSAAAARMRAGSVTSLNNGVAGGSGARMASIASHSAPRFQPTRVHFRGLTMEAAQWTLTSEQLQRIVSTAIRQSADASAIRILPQETLEDALPAEVERLEARSAELKTNYKLLVRRRNAALAHLARLAEGVEHAEPSTAGRVADELSELNESLDLTAEELYSVTDQLGQLARLRDLHQRSALAMALRKLNNSFLKQVGEVQRLRDLVETLEAEREEAWQEAQEVAQEFDDFTDRIMVDPASSSLSSAKDVAPSRRSSRVLLARKNSQRASKSGLRSSMYRRSHRSSTSSSHRYSGAASPGAWQPPGGGEDIPPVPPIPSRRDLIRFPSGDLPTRSSMDSPSSELRAMVQAQKELCEMLGISLEELKVHQPSRRQSMSALPGAKSPASQAPTRRNSDTVTPSRRSF